ncbi:hypothetical protein M569_12485 [Genlisea aurea]|uniref:CCHC-type domain-containing protein n=1 Tax=Genlisea aurea TaxID=192259 RepID=S8CCZ0_9LAMI|nr:hypothetical protein M569_12485 [Genlisea aurea]
MAATKSIVAELNKDLKLNGDNYDNWKMKIQYVIEEQDLLEHLSNTLDQPERGTTAQHRRDAEAYQAWKRKNGQARIILLSAMDDDITREFHRYEYAKDLWDALRDKFGVMSVSKLRSLTIKFDTYQKRPEHDMRRHLREMSLMMSELHNAGHQLTEEQKIQAVIRSLPNSWEHMKMHLTHSENVRTFDDVSRHLELEEDRLRAIKINSEVHMARSNSRRMSSSRNGKNKKGLGNVKKPDAQKKKRSQKVKLERVKCYNCQQKGHYASNCPEPKKIQDQRTT